MSDEFRSPVLQGDGGDAVAARPEAAPQDGVADAQERVPPDAAKMAAFHAAVAGRPPYRRKECCFPDRFFR